MNNNYEKFLEEIKVNAELQSALKEAEAAYTGDKEDRREIVEGLLIPFAESKGYSFTPEDVFAFEKTYEGSMDDGELESISGGKKFFCLIIGGNFKDCGCVIGGLAGIGGCTFIGA